MRCYSRDSIDKSVSKVWLMDDTFLSMNHQMARDRCKKAPKLVFSFFDFCVCES